MPIHVRLPNGFDIACRTRGLKPTRFLVTVAVRTQSLQVLEQTSDQSSGNFPKSYQCRHACLVSTSRFGAGQKMGSNQTPLGLHRIAEKIGAGQPIGTVYRSRRPVGLTWRGSPQEPIVHRILWLEGLEPGANRGGDVDSYSRYIYIHGTNDEIALGRPVSPGCIHLSAADLIPIFDLLPTGTLVWIAL